VLVGDLFGRRLAARNTGVVDQDVDLAVPGHQLAGGLGDAPGVGHVQDRDLGLVAFRLEAGAAGLGRLGIAVGDDDPGAGFSRAPPNRRARSPGRRR